MTGKEYNLVKEFVQAMVDESTPIKMNGKVGVIVSQASIEKMLGRILEFVVERG